MKSKLTAIVAFTFGALMLSTGVASAVHPDDCKAGGGTVAWVGDPDYRTRTAVCTCNGGAHHGAEVVGRIWVAEHIPIVCIGGAA